MDKFLLDYKESTGVSIQKFVTIAIENYKNQIQLDQAIRDFPLNQPLLELGAGEPYHRENEVWHFGSDNTNPTIKK